MKLKGDYIGFRNWDFDDKNDLLPVSGFTDTPWTPGRALKAECIKHYGEILHEEAAPAADCTCGYYVKRTPHEADYGGAVIGAVKFWGKTCVHTDGTIRCEYVQLIAISPTAGVYDSPKEEAKYIKCANRYEIDLIEPTKYISQQLDRLMEYAENYGEILSEDYVIKCIEYNRKLIKEHQKANPQKMANISATLKQVYTPLKSHAHYWGSNATVPVRKRKPQNIQQRYMQIVAKDLKRQVDFERELYKNLTQDKGPGLDYKGAFYHNKIIRQFHRRKK